MLGCIGYLLFVVAGGLVRDIFRPQQAVGSREQEAHLVAHRQLGGQIDVEAKHPHPAKVGHFPYVERGESYYLVFYVVVESIYAQRQIAREREWLPLPCDAHVVFLGHFGFQTYRARLVIIQVIEGRHAESMFEHDPDIERFIGQQSVGE